MILLQCQDFQHLEAFANFGQTWLCAWRTLMAFMMVMLLYPASTEAAQTTFGLLDEALLLHSGRITARTH